MYFITNVLFFHFCDLKLLFFLFQPSKLTASYRLNLDSDNTNKSHGFKGKLLYAIRAYIHDLAKAFGNFSKNLKDVDPEFDKINENNENKTD